MTEVEALKIRLFDLGEQAGALQSAINEVAKITGFSGDSIKDFVEHVKGVVNIPDENQVP